MPVGLVRGSHRLDPILDFPSCVTRFAELEEKANYVLLEYKLRDTDLSPATRFLLDGKDLSRTMKLMLSLVIFDGYELFPAHDELRPHSEGAGDRDV